MPLTEDDFGKPTPRSALPRRATGACVPNHQIGESLQDVAHDSPVRASRPHDLGRGHFAVGSGFKDEAGPQRRSRKTVCTADGKVMDCQRPSSSKPRRPHVQPIDFIPIPQKNPLDSSKRCFDTGRHPTGYENPDTWEDPGGPGVRPSHPVSPVGVVALDHRRPFPEQQFRETDLARYSEAPVARSQWGGWARSGAPGRGPMRGPWDSLRPDPGSTEAKCRFSDACKKPFPDTSYEDTRHMTDWHWDTEPAPKKVPFDYQANANTPGHVPHAGKPSLPGQ